MLLCYSLQHSCSELSLLSHSQYVWEINFCKAVVWDRFPSMFYIESSLGKFRWKKKKPTTVHRWGLVEELELAVLCLSAPSCEVLSSSHLALWVCVGAWFTPCWSCPQVTGMPVCEPVCGSGCASFLHRQVLASSQLVKTFGVPRTQKREEGVGQGQFRWGPHPLVESPTVYPNLPTAAESQECFQDSAAKVSWNSSAQRHMLGSLLREISFLGKLKRRNFLCGQTELPDLKASWKGNSFIMKWQIKDIPAEFTSKQLLRAEAKPYYAPSQNKNKSLPDRFLRAGLYPSPYTFLHSPSRAPFLPPPPLAATISIFNGSRSSLRRPRVSSLPLFVLTLPNPNLHKSTILARLMENDPFHVKQW